MGKLHWRDIEAKQLSLLRVVAEPFLKDSKWPVFDYVERTLAEREGLDAGSVLNGMERSPESVGWARSYGLASVSTSIPPRADETVALTLAGLASLGTVGAQFAETGVWLIAQLAEAEAELVPDPYRVVTGARNREQLEELFASAPRGWVRSSDAPTLDGLGLVLSREQATLDGVTFTETWCEFRLSPRLRAFRGVTSVEDYVERIESFLGVHAGVPLQQQPQLFSLLAALEYLDVVWQLRFDGQHLLGATPPARLVLLDGNCATEQDFVRSIAALSDVLDALGPQLPGRELGLARLARRLNEVLPVDARAEVSAAVERLRLVRNIRHGQLHTGAQSKGARALVNLGCTYPVDSWPSAWATVRRATTDALEVIRNEVYGHQGGTSDR
jgi:hypothetical protein